MASGRANSIYSGLWSYGFAGAVVVMGAGWMRFAGRKLSDESLMFGSPSVGKSLIHIDESSYE